MQPDNPFTSFGSWVRNRRRQLDLTQAELGRRASCAEATIRKIEADERKPSRQLAELLARALAIPNNETGRFLKFARGAWLEDPVFGSKPALPVPNNLPGLLTSTVNRVRDHNAVTALLKDQNVRLVTLIGPPGIGKTRLGIHCGTELLSQFADGVWFVDLSEVRKPAFFIPALARSLTSMDLPPSPEIAQLLNALRHRQMLLILDNFEQIVESAALDAAQILKNCPKIKMLVTSRLPLHIYGENEYPLPPLTVPPQEGPLTAGALMQYESVQLLVARIRQHQPGFAVTVDNANAIRQICIIVEGIPLALELAAASLRQLSLEEMARLLHGRDWIARIATPARDLPQRQRTLENVIEWSYDLLSDAERVFYTRLGVLADCFEAGAAAALNETSVDQALALLARLTDHSLLSRRSLDSRVQWRMLEIVRAHAYARLVDPEQIEQARANYFINQIQEISQTAPPQSREAYFLDQQANLHASLAWLIRTGKAELACSLIAQLQDLWNSLGFFKEGLEFCLQLDQLRDLLQPRQRAALAQDTADLAWQQRDFDTALSFARQAVELGQVYGLAGEYPLYLNRLGRIYIEQGRLAEAQTALQEALARSKDAGALLNPGVPLAQLGEIALFMGNLDEAKALLEQAWSQLEQGEKIFHAMTATDLAEVALAAGDFAQTRQWLQAALVPAKNHIRRLMVLLTALVGYLVQLPGGSLESAARFLGTIDALSDRSGVTLGSFYQAAILNRSRLVQQTLSEQEWRAAFSDGRSWSKDAAYQSAGTALESPGAH